MVVIKRILVAAAVALATILGASGPANAAPDPDDFRNMGNGIWCPLPWLETGYGPLSWCTEIAGDYGGTGWYGPSNEGLPTWANDFPISSAFACVSKAQEAGGGVQGISKTVGTLNAGAFGQIRPGNLYSYFGFQPIGRPGHTTGPFGDRQFHSVGDWLHANRDFTPSTVDICYRIY
ncbi:hypothetical protein [Nonomuraea sp. NPDC050643]|uniref:hypothetical protein n=1 Tax=Nonomuraea sp. NPDC050643 TaxID=3155660 RepID=UPI00340054CA